MLRNNKFSIRLPHKLLFIILTVTFVFSIYSADNAKRLIDNEIQSLQKTFTSISSYNGLYDDGSASPLSNLTSAGFIDLARNMLSVLASGPTLNEHLPEIKVFIKFDKLQKIYKDRELALRTGVNKDAREVPCEIYSSDEIFKCNVRLKGDLNDHWRARDRMSLKFKIKDGYILGMKRFSLQKARARQFPYDQIFHVLVRKLGGHSSDLQNFVRLKVNGEDWGVMNLEPDVDSRLLEVKGLKRLGVYRISNQEEWYFKSKYNGIDGYYPSDPRINLSIRGSDKILRENMDYLNAYSAIKKALWDMDGSIFDRKMMINNLVLSLAWGGLHTLYNSNSYYTWNPYTLKLEPFLTDQEKWQNVELLLGNFSLPYEYTILFTEKPISHDEFVEALDDVSYLFTNFDLLVEMNKYKNTFFPNDRDFEYEPVSSNLNFINSNSTEIVELINAAPKVFIDDDEMMPETILADIEKFHQLDAYNDGLIRVYNLTNLPMTFQIISEEASDYISDDVYELQPSSQTGVSFVEIQSGLSKLELKNIRVAARFQNHVRYAYVDEVLSSDNVDKRVLINFGCTFYRGICKIVDDIQLSQTAMYDSQVEIGEGVIFELTKNANILFLGGLDATGSVKAPISFHGENSGGIYIRNAEKQKSSLVNVSFYNLGAVKTSKYSFTGTVNGYGGKFYLDNVQFKNCMAEDQLNIVHANIEIGAMKFDTALSDAFDCDFCNGEIDFLTFNKIGGDGLDVSGSDLVVQNIIASLVSDKAVSVGEQSKITLNQLEIKDVGTGIAVKDGSSALVREIRNPVVEYDLSMTYMKKPFFKGTTQLQVDSISGVSKIGGQTCIRERGTVLQINKNNCVETDVAIDDLYTGRMKK